MLRYFTVYDTDPQLVEVSISLYINISTVIKGEPTRAEPPAYAIHYMEFFSWRRVFDVVYRVVYRVARV